MSSLKSINIRKLNGSGIEKVSLTFLTASPQTANKHLFLNHRLGRKGEARVTEEDLIILCQIIMKNLTRLIFRGGRWLYTISISALLIVEAELRRLIKSLSPPSSLSPRLIAQKNLLKYSGRLWMVTPLSIYISFIDSITFIWSQGERFKLRLLHSVSEYLVKDWWRSDDLYDEHFSEEESLMRAKLYLYFGFA